MKKKFITSLALAVMGTAMMAGVASAELYTFMSNDKSGTPNDFVDLDHSQLYLWGINWKLPSNERILSATLFIENIYNNSVQSDDILKFYLVDNLKISVNSNGKDIWSTSDGASVGNELGQYLGTKFSAISDIGNWTDTIDMMTTQTNNSPATHPDHRGDGPHDLSFTIDISTLTTYLLSINPYTYTTGGVTKSYPWNFGIGIDPDCHYTNDGITLKITTASAPIPEPATMLLFGTGLVGIAGVAKRRLAKKV